MLAAAESPHLRPADGLNRRQVMWRLREQVSHHPSQPHGQLGGADVLAPAQVLVPLLLRQLITRQLVEPNRRHERRHGISSQQVLSQRRKQWPDWLLRWTPHLDGA